MSAPIPMPATCYGCVSPTVWGDGCRYCDRYARPCGRHDAHQHDLDAVLFAVQRREDRST